MAQGRDYIAEGMTEFGTTQPTMSNSADGGNAPVTDNPALQEFFKTIKGLESPAARVAELQAKRQALESQDKTTFMDKIGNMALPALLAGGAAMAGKGWGGLGALSGGVQATQQLAAEENAARAEQLKETQQLEEQQLQRLDKMFNRMQALGIANPDAFMDADGEALMSRDMLGFLFSGLPGFQFDVRTKRLMDFRNSNATFNKQWDLAWKGIENATNPEDAAAFAGDLLGLLRIDPDSPLHGRVVRALNRPDGAEKAIADLIQNSDFESLQGAVLWMADNGVTDPMQDPAGFARQLKFDGSNGGSTQLIQEEARQAVIEIRKYVDDPLNAENLRDFANKYGLGTDKYARAVAQAALAHDTVLAKAYDSYVGRWAERELTAGQVLTATLSFAKDVNMNKEMFNKLLGPLFNEYGITYEGLFDQQLGRLDTTIDAAEKEGRIDNGISMSTATLEVEEELDKRGLYLPRPVLTNIWNGAVGKAREEAGGQANDEKVPIKASRVREIFLGTINEMIERNAGDGE